MTLTVMAAMASRWRRLRLALLTVAALAIVHEASFRAEFGVGPGFDEEMASTGHGTWFSVFLGASLIFVAALAVSVVLRDRALKSELGRLDQSAVDLGPANGIRGEWLSLWLRLAVCVVTLFTAQENVEHLVSEGHLAWLEPVTGAGAVWVWASVAIVTGLFAAVGALVRWREATLRARIAQARSRHPRPTSTQPALRWAAIAAWGHSEELRARHVIGRAPPVSVEA